MNETTEDKVNDVVAGQNGPLVMCGTKKAPCTHTKNVPGHWEARPNFDREEFDCGRFEYDEHEWVYGHEEPTIEDINLHQYKCTQCGEVFDY